MTDTEISQRLQRLSLEWLAPPVGVAVVYRDYSCIAFDEVDDTIHKVKLYVASRIAASGIRGYCIVGADKNIICLLSLSADTVSPSAMETVFLSIHEKLIQKFGVDGFVGIANIEYDLKNLGNAYSEAYEMLGYKYQYSSKGVISASNISMFQYASAMSNTNTFERVVGCFTDGDIGKLSIRLDQLISEVRNKPNVSRTSIKRTLIELLIHILHIASNIDPNAEEVLQGRDPYRWIMAQDDTPVIKEWILKICSTLIEQRKSHNQKTEKDIVIRAQNYIDSNLQNSELTLQSISRELNVTAPYLSQMFSVEMGEGVISYINRQRMQRAGALLRTTETKIELIAVQLGFSTQNYFTQVFKKFYGITPTEYRKKLIKP